MLRTLLLSFIFYGLDVCAQEKIAVLELFTSQGCSSCPPAENLLRNLSATEAEQTVILSFHVDYWNKLGWTDPLSLPVFTERQRRYNEYGVSDGVYTPQLIVNGTSAFTGGNGPRLKRELTSLTDKKFPAKISVKSGPVNNGKLRVDYSVEGDTNESVMNFAIVTPLDETKVNAGENAGKTLVSTNTVRSFSYKLLIGQKGSVMLDLPPGIAIHKLKLIIYIQHTADAAVSGVLVTNLNE